MAKSKAKPKKKKSNDIMYAGNTIKEVMAVEAMHYYIQVGHDMFESESGKLSFTKDRTDEIYDQVLETLNYMREFGNEEEKEDAWNCLLHVRIWPLRIH